MIGEIKNNLSLFAAEAGKAVLSGGVAEALYRAVPMYSSDMGWLMPSKFGNIDALCFKGDTLYRVGALATMAFSFRYIWIGCRANGPTFVSIGSFAAGCLCLYFNDHKVSILSYCLLGLASYAMTEKMVSVAKETYSSVFPSGLFIPRLAKKSELDNRERIDRCNWAVTLVVVGQTARHVELIIEGIEGLKPFVEYAGLYGQICSFDPLNKGSEYDSGRVVLLSKAKYFEKYNNTLNLKVQSATWIGDYREIEKIRESIKSEIAIQEKGQLAVAFSPLGSHSIVNLLGYRFDWSRFRLVRSHNCLTWAVEKLKLAGISYELSNLSYIAAVPYQEVSKRRSK